MDNCSFCGDIMLADTEDWSTPVCYSHYVEASEKVEEWAKRLPMYLTKEIKIIFKQAYLEGYKDGKNE